MRISDWSSDVCSSDLEARLMADSSLDPDRAADIAFDAERTRVATGYKSAAFHDDIAGHIAGPHADAVVADNANRSAVGQRTVERRVERNACGVKALNRYRATILDRPGDRADRKSTRLNSSH